MIAGYSHRKLAEETAAGSSIDSRHLAECPGAAGCEELSAGPCSHPRL